MKDSITNRTSILRAVAFILFLLYAFQILNNTFYLHTHILDYGKVVTHAHPYSKSNSNEPVQDHKHTWNQILTLRSLDFLLPIIFIVLALLSIKKQTFLNSIFLSELRPACFILQKGRSPPIS